MGDRVTNVQTKQAHYTLTQASTTFNFKPVTAGIVERREQGLVVLSPSSGRFSRRVLFVNNYGGIAVWEKIRQGLVPPHHLWGCLELVRMGYEVALAEPVPDFNPRHRPVPHDLKLLKTVSSWLKRDDIVYCGHNVLYWIPFLRALGLMRRHIVSLLFAREPLNFGGAHSGVIALTPAALDQATRMAPKAKIAHLSWGVDLNSFPVLPYNPEWLLHCGIAGRDFRTVSQAAFRSGRPIRLISAWPLEGVRWPPNVQVIDGGHGNCVEEKKVSFHNLLHEHYAGSAGVLIITVNDSEQKDAFGFTNLLEAMAMSQPIILTRTGTVFEEVEVEREGCGLEVPPGDPAALAAAMDAIMSDRDRAESMGRTARKLCESRYSINRYASELHQFFESL